MLEKLLSYLQKPELYAQSTSKFWDDEHISKEMLEAHLNPNWDAASRNHDFIIRSVQWINEIAPSEQYPKLLDLGCGPGLYARQFYQVGYEVTGLDFSKRSIDYATENAKKNGYTISYYYMNYLTMDYYEEFDVITLIYCDFCVLSDNDRNILLTKIFRALKPGGFFIVDVNTPNVYLGRQEEKSWFFQEGGFWSEKPYLCLDAFYRYDNNTMLNQAVIVTQERTNCYNIWDHTFTLELLEKELSSNKFIGLDFFGDVAGADYTIEGNTICAIARKDI